METDSKIHKDMENALTWEPSVATTPIGVAVDNGVVTFYGPAWKLTKTRKRKNV